MAVNSIGGSSSSNALDSAQAMPQNQELGQQAFLKLLVTQLTNQDPLDPQDQSQFLAQLAQFASVEGINNLTTSQSRLQASQLLGKSVDALLNENNSFRIVSGKVGSVRWDNTGVTLTVQDIIQNKDVDVKLDQVSQVHED